MKILLLGRSRIARFGINSDVARRVKVIVMPPLPPRPAFFRPPQPSGLSANSVALQLGLVRKIDRQTGKMHFEKRQIKALRTPPVRSKGSVLADIRADAEAQADARIAALREKWAKNKL